MHARPPAQNVILVTPNETDQHRGTPHICRHTHKFEYTPGILASATLPGSAASHRSGFHSPASGPQISGFVFDAWMLTKTGVSFGTKISCIILPSRPRTGCESGRTVSRRHLSGAEIVHQQCRSLEAEAQ